jgi:hypothetical protein
MIRVFNSTARRMRLWRVCYYPPLIWLNIDLRQFAKTAFKNAVLYTRVYCMSLQLMSQYTWYSGL